VAIHVQATSVLLPNMMTTTTTKFALALRALRRYPFSPVLSEYRDSYLSTEGGWAPRTWPDFRVGSLVLPDPRNLTWTDLGLTFEGWALEAPRTVRHARDFLGPRVFAHHHHQVRQLVVLLVATVAFLSAVVSVLVWRYVKPGDLGLWHDTPRVLPGARVRPLRGPAGGHDQWVLRACGSVTPIASVLSTRLRRRARWVRVAECVLGTRYGTLGQLFRGRWTPDLIPNGSPREVAYLLGTISGGARCLGGGILVTEQRETKSLGTCGRCRLRVKNDCECARPDHVGTDETELYVVLDIRGDTCLVFPNLLAKLRLYALCRKRDETLLGALRTRAVEWCKSRGMDPVLSDLAVTGSLGLAMEASTLEITTRSQVSRGISSPPFPHSLG